MAPPEKLHSAGEGILLLEDDEAVRAIAARMLEQKGYVVFQAPGVEEALEIFEREGDKIHLVFSDVVLPHGPSLRFTDQLLSRRLRLRVLLSSGHTDERLRWSAIRDRGFRYVE